MMTITHGNQKVTIDKGELVGYQVGDYEFIHQKGSPGWGHSDTEMFPLIGPTAKASYRVQVPRGNAIQDQHGMLRDMDYRMEERVEDRVTFVKEYAAGTRIKNLKYPDRSKAEWLIWPFGFVFRKTFQVTSDGLKISFNITGERDMPFMLGYHPAFKLRSNHPYIQAGNRHISLQEVLDVGNRALLIADTLQLTLHDERPLKIISKGFSHFMLWTEVNNMICIEPITFYPYAVEQHALHEGFDYLTEKNKDFAVMLCPPSR